MSCAYCRRTHPAPTPGQARGGDMFRSYRPSWQVTLVPALLTAIAYVAPGNFGVNVAAGSDHRYALVWVVVAASSAAARMAGSVIS